MKKSILILCAIVALSSCSKNYSQGERVGIITKFSDKGLIWKSWELDLKVAPNIGNGGMVGNYEDNYFSIDNDNEVICETSVDSIKYFSKKGLPVIIEYQQMVGHSWFDNRGETEYFIKSIKRTK